MSIESRVYNNVLCMLQARGYEIPSSLFSRNLEKAMDNETNDWGRIPIVYRREGSSYKGVVVFFPMDSCGSIGKKHINRYIDIVGALNQFGYNVSHCIVIYKDKMTAYANGIIAGGMLESFREEFFYKNLPVHVDIPQHILLSPAEASAVPDWASLPEINGSDPNSRYYGAKINDIFKIIRKSTTSGCTVLYRLVTNTV